MKGRARKLQLTGHQCDQKSSVGDQILRTSRQWATVTHVFFRRPFNLKGKRPYCRWKVDITKQTEDSSIANWIAMFDSGASFFTLGHKLKNVCRGNPSFCFATYPLTLENFEMDACFWNYPLMHCKPLSIEYMPTDCLSSIWFYDLATGDWWSGDYFFIT